MNFPLQLSFPDLYQSPLYSPLGKKSDSCHLPHQEKSEERTNKRTFHLVIKQ